MKRVGALVAVLAACCAMGQAVAQSPSDFGLNAEVTRTFDQGLIYFKHDGKLVSQHTSNALPLLRELDKSAFRGAVVYLHGCDGINTLSTKTADLLAAAGYLVLLPDSFARMDKPKSCDALQFQSGLHRDVLQWRQAEADYAIKQVKALGAVDPERVFLMGLSEGAIAVATYKGEPVAGRIVEAWTCHAGWPEYRGLNAPANEPVLTLTSENDPWFQDPVLRGDCGEFIASPSPWRRSIVFRPPHPAASQHDLMWNKDVRTLVMAFLTMVGDRSGSNQRP
jgi:poly(3-hydroxybutyrate) depolymerase